VKSPGTGTRVDRPPAAGVALVLVGVGAVVVMLSIGRGGDALDAILMLPQVARWASPGGVYLAAGIGYGLLLSRLVRPARDQAALVVGIGIAVLAMVSQVAGSLGLLASPITAVAVLAPGWGGLIAFLWKRRKARVEIGRPVLMTWLMLVPIGVLVAAASAPPGWLWDSEYGGFDVLSYHLQLPQEWLVGGRIEPQAHNVYSYLPGSFEAAVLHCAAMTGAPRGVVGTLGGVARGGGGPGGGGGSADAVGLLANGGWRLISAQYLHAWLTVIAAWMVGRAARAGVLLGAGGPEGAGGVHGAEGADRRVARARDAGRIAAAMTLATPWCVVVGSLAYNEMGVVLLGAAALVAALDRGMPAWGRGLVAGLLVGGACGFKPTAMTFVAPGVAVALLMTSRPREWILLGIAGAAAGLAMLMPWMVRNWMVGGNPVFPFASGVFGSAHWTPEQVARYASGHAFEGSLLDRLGLLVAPDAGAGGGARDVERWRGMLNPQFGVLFPAAVGGLVAALGLSLRSTGAAGRSQESTTEARRPHRPAQAGRWMGAVVMGAMLGLGVAAWLLTTHLQSRFLIPLVIPACALVAMALAGAGGGDEGGKGDRRGGRGTSAGERVRWVLGVLLVLWQCNVLVVTFAQQRGGGPNEMTILGPGAFSGEYAMDPAETAASLLRRGVPAGSRVYLLGDSAPLYYTARLPRGVAAARSDHAASTPNSSLTNPIAAPAPAAGVELLWHTTWDTSPLGESVRAQGGRDPVWWTADLRRRGVTHVLVNFAELSRYQRSGWYDPAVTPERLAAWVRTLGPTIAEWEPRQALFLLPEAEAGGGDE